MKHIDLAFKYLPLREWWKTVEKEDDNEERD